MHTHLKHCIKYRVPVCILTNEAMKPKKSYGRHIKANIKENTIVLCFRIGLHYSWLKMPFFMAVAVSVNKAVAIVVAIVVAIAVVLVLATVY